MKRILNFFCVAILALTSLFAISACGGSNTKAADLLKTFVIEQDGKTVNADFTVPAEINVNDEKYKLTWTSNNNYVVIGNKSDASYIVNVTRPETAQEAKLTVSLKIDNGNKATKDFTVRVTPIDVYDFVDEFTEKVIFEQNGTSVTTDFDLVTSYSLANYPNETATISWESRNEELVRIEGNKAIVTPTDVETRVNLIATFSYKGETSKSTFSVKVASPMTDFERLQYWYNNEGITQTLSGYVVLIGNAYDEGYGNISLYMIDDTLQGGYYLYRVKTTVDEAAKITLGCHVTVTGTTNTNYSGLMETNAGGNLVVDTDVTPINVKDTVYAMDNDIIANAQSLYYRQSTLVSLSNWKVCDIGDPVAAGNNSTAMKVEKDGVKVTLRYSKYVQDTSTDEAVAEINAMISKFKVGDYVNVDGLLSYYDYDKEKYKQSAYQIYITGPDSVTAGSADTAPTPGKAVGSAISSFAGFAENYEEPKTISLPQDSNGVAISWSIPESCLSVTSSASITGNNLSITPVENKNELITIIGTFSKDGYETSVYYKFTTGKVAEQPGTPAEGELVTAPEAGVSYKLALVQENLNKDLYFAGAMSGFYYATTEDASAATDVILVETEGGFHLTMKDGTATKYLNVVREMGTDGKEHNNVKIEELASSVWTFNTEFNTLTTVLSDGKTYYLGTSNTHQTISASSIDKAPTSFVSHLYIGAIPEGEDPEQPETPEEGELVTAPKAGEAYKLALVQENLNKDLYFAGAMQGFYYATTEDASAATDVILVETEGGFHLTMKDGSATKYLNVVREMGTDGKEHNNVRIDDSAVSVWTFNTELNTLTTVLADGNTYYLGTYSNHSTISASTIDKAPTSFVSHLYTGSIPEETPEQPGTPDTPDNPSQDGEIITAPKAGEEYKLALIQGNLGKVLYITGSTSSNYLATTEDASLAAVVTLEEVIGGYHIKVVANGSTKYINLEEYTTSSGNPNAYLRLEDAPTAVWTFNTEYNTLTSELNGNTYYMGTYDTFQTFSASKISYASSSTNFISHLYKGAVAEVPEVPEVPEVDGSLSATITFDDVANRISFSSSQQVWSKDGITVTNNQGASTVPVADHSNPARFYKNSDLTIEYTEEFTTVVVTCAGDPKYHIPASLQIDGATITVSGTIVTITFETPVDSFTINGLPNQFRVAQIDIYTA